MRVKCEFIIFPGKFFLYIQTKMGIASGSEYNASMRHSPRRFPKGNLIIIITIILVVVVVVVVVVVSIARFSRRFLTFQRLPSKMVSTVKVISGVLVRLTTCKRLTNSLPKLSLITLSPPETAG